MSLKQALLASVFTLGLAGQGHAADVTADQAKAVSDQLRAFLTSVLTDRVKIPADLLTVAPAGDAYSIAMQSEVGFLTRTDEGGKATNKWFTADVRPADGTKWNIVSLKFPSAYRLSKDGADALGMLMPPGANGPGGKAPTLEMTIRSQTASGDYDTSLTTDSHLNIVWDGIAYTASGLAPDANSKTSVDKMEAHYLLHPTGSGGVDYKVDGTLSGYTIVTGNPMMGPMTFKARKVIVRGETGALMTKQMGDIIRTLITLGLDVSAMADKGPDAQAEKDKTGREALRAVIGMMKGIMTGVKLDESFEGIEVKAGPGMGSAERAGIAFGGEAPGDTLKAFMEFKLNGLKIAGLPPEMVDFVPRSVVIRPTVSNIDVKALTQIAADAAQEGADPDAASGQLMMLMTGGGVKIGFDHMDADLGYASMTGHGEATVVGPNQVQGTADIEIKGFDQLMAHAAKMPNAQQAMGVLALAKGFGKTDGDRTVWHIAVSPDNKVLVNGVDITSMGK